MPKYPINKMRLKEGVRSPFLDSETEFVPL